MTRMSYRYKVCLKCQHYPCKKEKECIEVNLKTMQIYFNNFDRKTEPQPCEWCKFYDGENCFSQEPCKVMLYFKTEPQTMYYPQVDGITPSVIVKDEPQTCSNCKFENEKWYGEECGSCVDLNNWQSKDEPQTDCSWK